LSGFKSWVEDFDIPLFAQVGEPLVEEEIDLLLEEDFFDAGGDSFEGRNGVAGAVERQQRVAVVSFDLLGGDTDAGAETLLDEAEYFKPESEIGIDAFGGEIVLDEECYPSVVGGAVLVNTGGEFLADFCQTGVYFVVGRLNGLSVFAANLLLNEGLADELLECAFGGQVPLSSAAGVEDREMDFFVDVAGENDMAVNDGDYLVEDYGGLGRRVGGGKTSQECEED